MIGEIGVMSGSYNVIHHSNVDDVVKHWWIFSYTTLTILRRTNLLTRVKKELDIRENIENSHMSSKFCMTSMGGTCKWSYIQVSDH